jgi:hypothetical protein
MLPSELSQDHTMRHQRGPMGCQVHSKRSLISSVVSVKPKRRYMMTTDIITNTSPMGVIRFRGLDVWRVKEIAGRRPSEN